MLRCRPNNHRSVRVQGAGVQCSEPGLTLHQRKKHIAFGNSIIAKRRCEGLFCNKTNVDRLELFHKIRTHLPTSEFPNRNDNPRNPNACVCELLKKKLTFSDDIQPQDTKSCNVRGTTAKHHRPQPEPLAFSVPFASAHMGVRQW